MLWRLCVSDNLFLDDSITTAEDKHTDLAKPDATNARCKAIDSPKIGLAQHGHNMA
jgi:hypothetical protein